MASWIDEIIGTWDPHGGSGNSGNCLGCFVGIVLGGALLILFLSRPHFIACEKHSATFTTRTIARLFHPVLISWTIRSTAEWQAVNHRSDLMVFEAFLPQAGVIDICPRNSERGE